MKHSYALRVLDEDGVVHAFVYEAALPPWAVTRCGHPCHDWKVQVGGDPTCPACVRVLCQPMV